MFKLLSQKFGLVSNLGFDAWFRIQALLELMTYKLPLTALKMLINSHHFISQHQVGGL